MTIRELQPGLWHWQSDHPDWSPEEPWSAQVSSYALDDGANLVLFDPLGVPDDILERAADREPVVVLTAPWHERETKELVERLGVPVYAPPPDTQDDLVQKFGIPRERAVGGSPDLGWLLSGGGEARLYNAGDRLPLGIESFPGREHNDLVLWIESRGIVVSGDTLADFGDGLQIPAVWLRAGVNRDDVVAGLRPLLDLPVDLVLPAHGAPTDRAALARALG
jgi:glyoxylase-like metal-dependent hydrolase (beta-lactamase superfamily II)